MERVIKIVDSGMPRYTLEPKHIILGRMYDNEAETIVVEVPECENDSLCTMIITTTSGRIIDHINLVNKRYDITSNISQYSRVLIGFSFSKPNGYIKNSEICAGDFGEAQKPDDFVPVEPEQKDYVAHLIDYGFVNSGLDGNTLWFENSSGNRVVSFDLSPFTQEQSDLGETDDTKETFVKGKYTSNLINDSDYQTGSQVDEKIAQIPIPDVSEQIEQHNQSETAHPYIRGLINEKQDIIDDLSAIRSGASAGATALQPSALNNYYTKTESDNNLSTGLSGKLDKSGGSISGNLAIQGNLTVNGTTTTESQETLEVKDNFIYTNANKILLQTLLSGLGIYKDGSNVYAIAYDPVSDSVKLGVGTRDNDGIFHFNVGDGLPIAVRDDSNLLQNGHLLIWDSVHYKLIDSGLSSSDIIRNIIDGEDNSLIGNNITTNTIEDNGYINNLGQFVQLIESPIYITTPEDLNYQIKVEGYFVVASSLLENVTSGYKLYYFNSNAITLTVAEAIANISTVGQLLSENYKFNTKNQTILGEYNKGVASNHIISGKNNLSTGDSSLVIGEGNINDGGESIIAGLNCKNSGGGSLLIGGQHIAEENQATVTGYHNRILDGSYYSSSTGVGNVNKGTATFTSGGYNLAGSEFSTAEGIDNIAGGDIKYSNTSPADIEFYNNNTTYNIGNMVKRNGFVFVALQNDLRGIIPNLVNNLDKWSVVEPTITTRYAKASKASGEKCVAKNTGAFVHGLRLTSARDYQTVVGKYNVENANAMFVVGTGVDLLNKINALEVLANGKTNINGETTINDNTNINGTLMTYGSFGVTGATNLADTTVEGNINILGGSTTGVLRETSAGELVISGQGGMRLRPAGTSANTGLAIKTTDISPEKDNVVDLGKSNNKFKTAYITGLNLNGTNYTSTNFVSSTDRNNWNNKVDVSKGSVPPTTSTIGAEGQLYLDTTNNKTYQCTAITALGTNPETYSYTWEQLVKATDYSSLLPEVVTTVPQTLEVNKIYDLGEQATLNLVLPSGVVGNFIEVLFVSGNTPTNLSITSSSALSETDISPEANMSYSLFFEWVRLDATTYGWGISYIDYTKATN